jgi:hypothetical protein
MPGGVSRDTACGIGLTPVLTDNEDQRVRPGQPHAT